MTATICGYDVARKELLCDWQTLLEQWLCAARRFYDAVPTDGEDRSHVHKDNERVHVSILAGAAWLCGWSAVCEFKRAKNSTDRAGRADLWLKPLGSNPYLIEAKFDWDGPGLGKAEGLLEAAYTDAKDKRNGDEAACGVAFVCPSFSCNPEDLAGEIERVVDRLRLLTASSSADAAVAGAVAWCFPATERSAPSPGILLAARLCD